MMTDDDGNACPHCDDNTSITINFMVFDFECFTNDDGLMVLIVLVTVCIH